jgi:hypothetical protein
LESLAANRVGRIVMASAAISGNVLYDRTRGHVVAVGE